MMNVSVVIPVYNARYALPVMMERLARTLTPACDSFEVILVDDGSSDGSWEIIQDLKKSYPWIVGIRLPENAGQHPATLIGLRRANFPVTVIMDDDLQHPPESIPTLLAALTPAVDIVYAAPMQGYKPLAYRLLSALAKDTMAVLGGTLFLRHMQSFRALRTSVYPWSQLVVYRTMTIEGVLAAKHPRAAVVRVPYAARIAGNSTYTFRRSARLTFNIWRSLRVRPEHYATMSSLPPVEPAS